VRKVGQKGNREDLVEWEGRTERVGFPIEGGDDRGVSDKDKMALKGVLLGLISTQGGEEELYAERGQTRVLSHPFNWKRLATHFITSPKIETRRVKRGDWEAGLRFIPTRTAAPRISSRAT